VLSDVVVDRAARLDDGSDERRDRLVVRMSRVTTERLPVVELRDEDDIEVVGGARVVDADLVGADLRHSVGKGEEALTDLDRDLCPPRAGGDAPRNDMAKGHGTTLLGALTGSA
jgi:hypothetical protein